MKFLKIQNKGELDIMGLFLMGASTKRGDENTIGEFGSGWKYALAVLLRSGIEFFIYSGLKKISVATRKVTLRNNDFLMITIDGKDTNYTTEMGPEWDLWMALREIYSNAIDEGHCVIDALDLVEAAPFAGTTKVYIECTKEVEHIIDNWQSYFSFDRTDDVLEIPGKLKVFEALNKDKSIIYRKGIKVAESSEPGCYDYDFYNIPINELRVAKNFEDVRCALKQGLLKEFNSPVIKTILQSRDTWEHKIEFDLWDHMYNTKAWGEALNKTTVMPTEYSDKLTTTKETVCQQKDNGLLQVPNSLCKLIASSVPEILVLGYANTGQLVLPAKPSVAFRKKVDMALRILAGHSYAGLTIEIGEFESGYQKAFSKNGVITISTSLHDKSVDEIAKVILREAIVLETGHSCPSTALVDALVSDLYESLGGGHGYKVDTSCEDNEAALCHTCNGTGEGAAPHLRCTTCNGLGIEKPERVYDFI